MCFLENYSVHRTWRGKTAGSQSDSDSKKVTLFIIILNQILTVISVSGLCVSTHSSRHEPGPVELRITAQENHQNGRQVHRLY